MATEEDKYFYFQTDRSIIEKVAEYWGAVTYVEWWVKPRGQVSGKLQFDMSATNAYLV
jgi:hypothetical protein